MRAEYAADLVAALPDLREEPAGPEDPEDRRRRERRRLPLDRSDDARDGQAADAASRFTTTPRPAPELGRRSAPPRTSARTSGSRRCRRRCSWTSSSRSTARSWTSSTRTRKSALMVDEWGTWYTGLPGMNPGFLHQQNSLRDALVAAIHLNIFSQHADRVKMANIAQMVNVLQAMILTQRRQDAAHADVSRLRDVQAVQGRDGTCRSRSHRRTISEARTRFPPFMHPPPAARTVRCTWR